MVHSVHRARPAPCGRGRGPSPSFLMLTSVGGSDKINRLGAGIGRTAAENPPGGPGLQRYGGGSTVRVPAVVRGQSAGGARGLRVRRGPAAGARPRRGRWWWSGSGLPMRRRGGPVGRGVSSGVVRAWWAARSRRVAVSAGGPVRQAAVSGARRARCVVRGSPAWVMVCMRCASSGLGGSSGSLSSKGRCQLQFAARSPGARWCAAGCLWRAGGRSAAGLTAGCARRSDRGRPSRTPRG